MKALLMISALPILLAGSNLAAQGCAGDTEPTPFYGYSASVSTCPKKFKTLEEAEAALRTDPLGGSRPLMEYAFPLPGNFFANPTARGRLDYRPLGGNLELLFRAHRRCEHCPTSV